MPHVQLGTLLGECLPCNIKLEGHFCRLGFRKLFGHFLFPVAVAVAINRV